MIAGKITIFEFAIMQKISKFDRSTYAGRVAAARAAAPVIAQLRHLPMFFEYPRLVAEELDLNPIEVAALVDEASKQARSESVAKMRRDSGAQVPAEAPPADSGEASQYPAMNLSDPIMRFERQLLEVIVQVPAASDRAVVLRICKSGFSAPAHIAVANAIEAAVDLLGKHEFLPTLAAAVPQELYSVLLEIAGQTLPARDEAGLVIYAQGVIERGLKAILAREKTELLSALRREEPASEAHKAIAQKLQNLEAERRGLGDG
jgi:DNA primase